jgi:hypothetical protein
VRSYIYNFYFARSFVSFFTTCLMAATGCRTPFRLNIRWPARKPRWRHETTAATLHIILLQNKRVFLVFISHGAGPNFNSTVQTQKHVVTAVAVQGYSKRSIHFKKIILLVLLNIWRRAVYRLKWELSKLFSHLTSTRCEPHVWRGRCEIDNPALPTLHILRLADRIIACAPGTWREIRIRILSDFLSVRTQDMNLASVAFVK